MSELTDRLRFLTKIHGDRSQHEAIAEAADRLEELERWQASVRFHAATGPISGDRYGEVDYLDLQERVLREDDK